MADTKITALAAITTVDPAADVLPIVDISDTSMAASGTTKKITSNQILGAGGTATLASATITGDLTVATNTLKTTGGNVGIGTVTPDIFSRFYTRTIGFNSSGSTVLQINGSSYSGIDLGAAGTRTFGIASSATDASLTTLTNIPIVFGINGSEAMRLNSTGLGVGVTPSAKLDVSANDGTMAIFRSSGGSSNDKRLTISTGGAKVVFNISDNSNTAIARAYEFQTAGSAAMTLDASGNLLVGLTSPLINTTRRLSVSGTVAAALQSTGAATVETINVWHTATSGNNIFVDFDTEASVTSRGSISYNRAGGLVAYNTTSDYRAKDIIGPVSNSGSLIDSLKVYVGKMKGATIERPMLIAHEAQEVAPYSVTGVKDEVDADGKDKYQQMDVSSFVPLLIAEIQSLRARVQTLEAK